MIPILGHPPDRKRAYLVEKIYALSGDGMSAPGRPLGALTQPKYRFKISGLVRFLGLPR